MPNRRRLFILCTFILALETHVFFCPSAIAAPWTALRDPSPRDLSKDPALAPLALNLSTPNDTTTPACDVLRGENIGKATNDGLKDCFLALQREYTTDSPAPDDASQFNPKLEKKMGVEVAEEAVALGRQKWKALQLKSAREKAFLGMVLACFGEAVPSGNTCDRELVMLTIQNRVRVCNGQFPNNPPSQQYQALDVALQPSQFSAFNIGEYIKYDIRPFDLHPELGPEDFELIKTRMAKRLKRAPKDEEVKKRATELEGHVRKCFDAFRAFAASDYNSFAPKPPQVDLHIQQDEVTLPELSSQTNLPAALNGLEQAKKEQERKALQTPAPIAPHRIMYYFTKDIAERGKHPKWTKWSTITDLTCKLPHKAKPEVAHDVHFVFTDDWDCSPLRRWKRHPGLPMPPKRPSSFEPAENNPTGTEAAPQAPK